MALVEVVSSHHERAVIRLGDLYVKVETDPDRARREIAALMGVPIPVPEIVWSRAGPPAVLALSALRGEALARLGEPTPYDDEVWSAAGAMARTLHSALPPEALAGWRPPNPGVAIEATTRWLHDNVPATRARLGLLSSFASEKLVDRPVPSALVHGDLQAEHVLIDEGTIAGVLDWGDVAIGDPLHDLAILTIGHTERLEAVIAGYGGDPDRAVIRAYWYVRRLGSVKWMIEHGYDASGDIAALDEVSVAPASRGTAGFA